MDHSIPKITKALLNGIVHENQKKLLPEGVYDKILEQARNLYEVIHDDIENAWVEFNKYKEVSKNPETFLQTQSSISIIPRNKENRYELFISNRLDKSTSKNKDKLISLEEELETLWYKYNSQSALISTVIRNVIYEKYGMDMWLYQKDDILEWCLRFPIDEEEYYRYERFLK